MTDPVALHHELLTLDSHIDIPWPDGPDPFGETKCCVDMPKMRRGGVWAGCFAAYIPQGKRDPEGHEAAFERAIAMLETIRGMARQHDGITARLAVTADEIETARRDGALAIVPAVENGHAMGDDPGRLRRFRDLGARYLTLTHNGHNDLADSANPRTDLGDRPEEHSGLSALGRTAIAELNRLGMLVDVSHLSKPGMLQAAELSRVPIVATHSCVRALCDHARNLDDEQLDALGAADGLVQITAVPGFLRPQGKVDTVTVADYVDHVDHAVRRIGIAHVGISSDFDGGGGFTGWRDASESPNLTAELWRRGYGREEIAALWSGNFLRLLRQAEKAAE
ncbi:MAG: dipeptidase [Acidisphaera sp.]|nr:dipeptidase [Acidisphaera sp.]